MTLESGRITRFLKTDDILLDKRVVYKIFM